MLSVFALGSSGFKSDNIIHIEETEDHCFEDARIFVIILDGEINLDNIDYVLWLTAQCEMNVPILQPELGDW
jgi:hypothetical protein